MVDMWNKIFTIECVTVMQKVSAQELNENGEDMKLINQFIKFAKERLDYKMIVVLATKWDEYDPIKQAGIAVNYASQFHASRFIILLDYLSIKYKKGELV